MALDLVLAKRINATITKTVGNEPVEKFSRKIRNSYKKIANLRNRPKFINYSSSCDFSDVSLNCSCQAYTFFSYFTFHSPTAKAHVYDILHLSFQHSETTFSRVCMLMSDTDTLFLHTKKIFSVLHLSFFLFFCVS